MILTSDTPVSFISSLIGMLYSLPGPVDWWNHLLLMQLTDIGTHLDASNPMQAWR